MEEVKNEAQQLQAEIDELLKEVRDLKKSIGGLKAHNTVLRKKIEHLTKELESRSATAETFANKCTIGEEERSKLKKELRELTVESERLKAALSKEQNKTLWQHIFG